MAPFLLLFEQQQGRERREGKSKVRREGAGIWGWVFPLARLENGKSGPVTTAMLSLHPSVS